MDMMPTLSFRWLITDSKSPLAMHKDRVLQQLFVRPNADPEDSPGRREGEEREWRDVPEVINIEQEQRTDESTDADFKIPQNYRLSDGSQCSAVPLVSNEPTPPQGSLLVPDVPGKPGLWVAENGTRMICLDG